MTTKTFIRRDAEYGWLHFAYRSQNGREQTQHASLEFMRLIATDELFSEIAELKLGEEVEIDICARSRVLNISASPKSAGLFSLVRRG